MSVGRGRKSQEGGSGAGGKEEQVGRECRGISQGGKQDQMSRG